MTQLYPRLLFDEKDLQLLNLVQDVLNREDSRKSFKDLLNPYLSPHGIKEMAASQAFRIAYAMTNLLHSLEIGEAKDRLSALRSLHDEVMNITHSSLRRNTARVLLQIMKELVRVQGNRERQLELAHDFRMAVSGKPRFIRAELRRYHLVEMPEEWNQIAFDDHVHDANTKGRKTATHLIMDAWIKGIRRLTVIYYNHVPSEAAAELLEAGEIMGITIRIGVSIAARHHGQNVHFIWVPRGFCDAEDFLAFLSEPHIRKFMDEGRQVSEHSRHEVLDILQEFNRKQRLAINDALNIALPVLDPADFLASVGCGQPSLLHLADFVHAQLLPLMEARVADFRLLYPGATEVERKGMESLVERMREFDSQALLAQYLQPTRQLSFPDSDLSGKRNAPRLLTLSPRELLQELDQLHAGYRICLNLSDLGVEDVLEMVYDCAGKITHLEIFNLKDYVTGKTTHYQEISELQRAINEGNVITLKKIIHDVRRRLEQSSYPDREDRIAKMSELLRNIPALQSHYRDVPLGAYIGSDSTGRSPHQYGMGLVVQDTLTARARKEIPHTLGPRIFTLPVRMTVHLRITYFYPTLAGGLKKLFHRLLHLVPRPQALETLRRQDWEIQDNATRFAPPGNVIPLGGLHEEGGNELYIVPRALASEQGYSWRYLNSGLKNTIKVLIGFIPAFLTFALTKDWWLLAYGGAFIWFGITGLRNILQSVLGGGGFRRSPLLRWNDYVSWDRMTDSLLFTGFSVPLLDYLIKTVLLERGFGITTMTNPTLLYSVIALTNGLYLCSHNAFRGLPQGAIYGNLFRSVLSIPLAIAFNAVIGGLLLEAGVTAVNEVLQKWAAVISKTASDCVAGVIEGLADRHENIRIRTRDYIVKLRQLFDTYARFELLFPEADALEMIESPGKISQEKGSEVQEVERILIINALDLLYFWMYQPRARSVLNASLRSMSEEERRIFVGSQGVLQRQHEIGQLFLDGIIGKNFAAGLSFYLNRYQEYLASLQHTALRQSL